jgi:hypothetical protein
VLVIQPNWRSDDFELEILAERADRGTLEQLDGAVRLDPSAFAPRRHRGWLLNQIGR